MAVVFEYFFSLCFAHPYLLKERIPLSLEFRVREQKLQKVFPYKEK